MSAKIIWACDIDGCDESIDVVVVDVADVGCIEGSACWPPGKWMSFGVTRCPAHQEEYTRENFTGDAWA